MPSALQNQFKAVPHATPRFSNVGGVVGGGTGTPYRKSHLVGRAGRLNSPEFPWKDQPPTAIKDRTLRSAKSYGSATTTRKKTHTHAGIRAHHPGLISSDCLRQFDECPLVTLRLSPAGRRSPVASRQSQVVHQRRPLQLLHASHPTVHLADLLQEGESSSSTGTQSVWLLRLRSNFDMVGEARVTSLFMRAETPRRSLFV